MSKKNGGSKVVHLIINRKECTKNNNNAANVKNIKKNIQYSKIKKELKKDKYKLTN